MRCPASASPAAAVREGHALGGSATRILCSAAEVPCQINQWDETEVSSRPYSLWGPWESSSSPHLAPCGCWCSLVPWLMTTSPQSLPPCSHGLPFCLQNLPRPRCRADTRLHSGPTRAIQGHRPSSNPEHHGGQHLQVPGTRTRSLWGHFSARHSVLPGGVGPPASVPSRTAWPRACLPRLLIFLAGLIGKTESGSSGKSLMPLAQRLRY